MDSENWYRVDNVGKMFLATHNKRDTRTIRVSATLTEPIEPELLQQAVNKAAAARSVFQVRIRHGVFWHYIEPTDARPTVTEEHDRPCPSLYGKNYRGTLHYSVTYYRDRINLEIFHVLSDGTGTMDFLNIIVLEYLKLKYPERLSEVYVGSGASMCELEQDSFRQFTDKSAGEAPSGERAYHIRGVSLPYDQLRFMKVSIPSAPLIAAAKSMGVSLTSYIGAKLMTAIYHDMPVSKRGLPVTVSIPVNLRNYYSSDTSRNFFNSVSVSHVFSSEISVEELASEFDAQLKENLKPENIHKRMAHFQRLERLVLLRMVPLFIKQPVIRFCARQEAKKVSAVVSNLGIIRLPEQLAEYIRDYEVLCSHSNLYISLCTYGDHITLGITNDKLSTGVLRDFVRSISDGDAVLQSTEVIR
ncbi:MAG: hypothetical protein ACI4KM_09660 [Oscillospiraceae bacterium]